MRDIPKTHNMIHANKPSGRTTKSEWRLLFLKNSPRRKSPIGKVTTMMTSSAIDCTTNPCIPLPSAPARNRNKTAATISNTMPFPTTERTRPTAERTRPNSELLSVTTYQSSNHPSTTTTTSADMPRTIFATLMKNPVGRRTRTAAAYDFAVRTPSFISIAIAPSYPDAPILSPLAAPCTPLAEPTPPPIPLAPPANRRPHRSRSPRRRTPCPSPLSPLPPPQNGRPPPHLRVRLMPRRPHASTTAPSLRMRP